MGTVLEGLRHARVVAQQHMRDRIDQGTMWDERTVTHLLLAEAYKEGEIIRYAEFTQPQEYEVGADWIWWFIDRADECFGMLIQAKSLKVAGDGHFRIDFSYGQSRQIVQLQDSANILNMPAAYALYCGDPTYRAQLACQRGCAQPACARCEQKSVSVVAALIAHHSIEYGPAMSAVQSFQNAEALETLGEPISAAPPLAFTRSRVLAPDLKRFLSQPQSGARAIAKSLLDQIMRVRAGQFSAPVTSLVDAGEDVIFRECPDDRGHFSVSYMPHVLRGLRLRPPSYVSDFIRFGIVPDHIVAAAGGIAVVVI
ncbi:hypothetical protein ACFWAY_17980 [Rhodococcus sp. NPDC059968]|uniref:hypothetical protein n=1 Tax=Rhodococcus sp. NPDC059968 TaxID=3347017 RepID=UPI00366F3069